METKIVFLDVDGTLVSFRTHRVPDSALEALRRAHARGVRLFIATGRAVGDLEPVAAIPYDGVVGLNGADCVLRTGEVIARYPIPQEAFERAMALSDELGFPVGLELDGGIYVNRMSPAVTELAAQVAHPVPELTDLRELFARTVCCQMCFYLDEALERRVMEQLPGLSTNRWSPLFTDVNVRGVDKASGIAAVTDYFGLSRDETMAFGDGGNDVVMLRAAGIGVAMGNGSAAAREAADYVTADIDDDGLQRALEHLGVI